MTSKMTSRQCEIAAESYAACLLAQAGYDVLVQYGANQPQYDLVAVKGKSLLLVSVKGSQDGAWMLAVKFKNKSNSYHDAIERWLGAQRDDVAFVFVQFSEITFGNSPRVYVASPREIAEYLKTQCNGRGYGSLEEDCRRHKPNSKYDHRIPSAWVFTVGRIDSIGPQN